MISPDELRADTAYYAQAAEGATSQVRQSEAALRLEEQQTENQSARPRRRRRRRGAAGLGEADLENAHADLRPHAGLLKAGVVSAEQFDQSRTAYDALKARVASLGKQADRRARRWRSRKPMPSRWRCGAASCRRASSSWPRRPRSARRPTSA